MPAKPGPGWPTIYAGPVVIDLIRQKAWWDGHEVDVAGAPMHILILLALRAPKRVSRGELYKLLDDAEQQDTKRLDVHVSRLRTGLRVVGADVALVTTPLKGYHLAIELNGQKPAILTRARQLGQVKDGPVEAVDCRRSGTARDLGHDRCRSVAAGRG